jgi:hypothetical protein
MKIDHKNAVIKNVAVFTNGERVRGHEFSADHCTLAQALRAGRERGQVPVSLEHKHGTPDVPAAAQTVGFLENFQINGDSLLADFHLLQSHPAAGQILETAERMPQVVGFKMGFTAPTGEAGGPARIKEILFAYFDAAVPTKIHELARAGLVGRTSEFSATGPALRVTEDVLKRVGATLRRAPYVPGQKPSGWLRDIAVPATIAGASGALVAEGVGLVGRKVSKWRREAKKEDTLARLHRMAAKLGRCIELSRPPPLDRLGGALEQNAEIPRPEIPYAAQANAARGLLHKHPLLRKIAWQGLKIGIGAGAGGLLAAALHKASRRRVVQSGAAAGAIAGIIS